jgi:uroporphyrin-III C-methyltransferase/precorrin-2 dehydrogenase/sirohydrochlorin ferrochelatase
MEFLPVFLNVTGRPCLVVGGGEVAARKAALLRQAGGRVAVVAPQLGRTLQESLENREIAYRQGPFEPTDLEGAHLVVAATDDPGVNARVAEEAGERRIPVNVVDRPELCTFVVPSIIDRSPIVIAVSSSGAAPVLARLVRARLETLIPATYGRLAKLAADYRQQVKDKFRHSPDRRKFWERVLQGPIAEMVYSGRDGAAREALDATLKAETGEPGTTGEVYLVGGGPGDPDLLTFRALRLMQQADVVVYDRLVANAVLELTRRDAERIYVGKERDNHALRQEEINQLLARLAKQGKRVLRLKGGDPFIFGRGGEEIDTLAQEGVPFQVVPGITAASGSASYAGIPLTHRDYAQACVFVTGHLKDHSVNLNWQMLAQPQQTVVFYMGLKGLDEICGQLVAHGVSPDMPAALIQQATTYRQRVFIGTLTTLPAIAHAAQPKPPTLIIVGEVVRLHEKLAWFEPVETTVADSEW